MLTTHSISKLLLIVCMKYIIISCLYKLVYKICINGYHVLTFLIKLIQKSHIVCIITALQCIWFIFLNTLDIILHENIIAKFQTYLMNCSVHERIQRYWYPQSVSLQNKHYTSVQVDVYTTKLVHLFCFPSTIRNWHKK